MKVKLFYKKGSSDKVYNVEYKAGFVHFSYGRRGSVLTKGIKNSTKLKKSDAMVVFEKLVQAKTKKGYEVVEEFKDEEKMKRDRDCNDNVTVFDIPSQKKK